MTDAARELGARIVEINRAARMGATSLTEWSARLHKMVQAQPEISGQVQVHSVRALEGGAGSSSGTLFFDVGCSISGTFAARKCVLRFQPAELLFHEYDLRGQVLIQRAMAASGVPVPEQFWEDCRGRHLGTPGYVMERVSGVAAPAAWFAEGIIAEAVPSRRRELISSFIATLAKIHSRDWRGLGLAFLLERAGGSRLIEREINWYLDALRLAGETQAVTNFDPITRWLVSNEPTHKRAVLCHGDANFTNFLFGDTGVAAVLDWEMAFIGVPEADIAYATVGMGSLTTDFPAGVPQPDEIIAQYEQLSGHRLSHMSYYRLFAFFRLSAIFALGMRAFPNEFKPHFQAFAERTASRMRSLARELGVT